MSADPDPPKKVTVREAMAIIVVFAVIIGVMGFAIDDWPDAIGAGIVGAGCNLLSRWWQRHTHQPEYEDVDGGDE
ncbi:hypothetical protein ACTWJ8_31820 [Streptomyces sp. SDT5-1]|uniref:hypothetical protein n=1 Tax=Streptomyces sp. SDT5-1 TaxID=3406418 RepID=UPI003FD1B82B